MKKIIMAVLLATSVGFLISGIGQAADPNELPRSKLRGIKSTYKE